MAFGVSYSPKEWAGERWYRSERSRAPYDDWLQRGSPSDTLFVAAKCYNRTTKGFRTYVRPAERIVYINVERCMATTCEFSRRSGSTRRFAPRGSTGCCARATTDVPAKGRAESAAASRGSRQACARDPRRLIRARRQTLFRRRLDRRRPDDMPEDLRARYRAVQGLRRDGAIPRVAMGQERGRVSLERTPRRGGDDTAALSRLACSHEDDVQPPHASRCVLRAAGVLRGAMLAPSEPPAGFARVDAVACAHGAAHSRSAHSRSAHSRSLVRFPCLLV